MQVFSFKAYRVCFSIFLMGLFFFGALTEFSYAADGRVGFVDIQKAVLNTKEWKRGFESF